MTAFLIAPLLAAPPTIFHQTSPVSDVSGNRYKICFTASDQGGSTTECMHITVIGACTPATADINIDGKVDILDAAILVSHFGENETGLPPEPYNLLNHPTVDVADASCLASMFDQETPV